MSEIKEKGSCPYCNSEKCNCTNNVVPGLESTSLIELLFLLIVMAIIMFSTSIMLGVAVFGGVLFGLVVALNIFRKVVYLIKSFRSNKDNQEKE